MPGNLGMKAELEMNTMAGLDSLSKQEFSLAFISPAVFLNFCMGKCIKKILTKCQLLTTCTLCPEPREYISIVYKRPSLRYSITAVQNGLKLNIDARSEIVAMTDSQKCGAALELDNG